MSAWKQRASSRGDGEGFAKAPPGNHPAALVAIVDLGDQKNEYKGVETVQRRAFFCWELVLEKVPGTSRNHLVGIDLTVSLNEKAKLRQWIEAWRGKKLADGEEYDISVLLGKKCLLNVEEKNGYPKVSGVAAVPRGMAVPEPQTKPFLWGCEKIEEEGGINLPDWLPYLYGESLKTHIEGRVTKDQREPAMAGVGDANEGDGGGEIPF